MSCRSRVPSSNPSRRRWSFSSRVSPSLRARGRSTGWAPPSRWKGGSSMSPHLPFVTGSWGGAQDGAAWLSSSLSLLAPLMPQAQPCPCLLRHRSMVAEVAKNGEDQWISGLPDPAVGQSVFCLILQVSQTSLLGTNGLPTAIQWSMQRLEVAFKEHRQGAPGQEEAERGKRGERGVEEILVGVRLRQAV